MSCYIDKDSNIGAVEETIWEGTPTLKIKGEKRHYKHPDGLYLITIETNGGQVTVGWFIAHDMTSTDTPEVFQPQSGDVVSAPNPVVRFEDFKSPQYRSHQHRGVSVAVTQLFPNNGWDFRWGRYSDADGITEMILGVDGYLPDESFGVGRYWVSTKFTETQQFGGLKLHRSSETNRILEIR